MSIDPSLQGVACSTDYCRKLHSNSKSLTFFNGKKSDGNYYLLHIYIYMCVCVHTNRQVSVLAICGTHRPTSAPRTSMSTPSNLGNCLRPNSQSASSAASEASAGSASMYAAYSTAPPGMAPNFKGKTYTLWKKRYETWIFACIFKSILCWASCSLASSVQDLVVVKRERNPGLVLQYCILI